MARKPWNKGRNLLLKRLIIFIFIMVVLLVAAIIVKEKFTISSITVVGNEHYTDDEIIDLVVTKPYERNSIILYLKYNNKSIKDIPFVEQMDVSIESPTSVKITVYEKAVAGYVEYLGHYMYFDKDGIVVEGSSRTTEGIPFVTGLVFDHMVLHEKLPVENEDVFMMILTITQLLNKYEITTDRIYFDINDKITLYFGDARVYLGSSAYIDEKINEMHLLLPKLEGHSGVLNMENYTGDTSVFSFTKDKEEGQPVEVLDEGLDAEDATEEASQNEE